LIILSGIVLISTTVKTTLPKKMDCESAYGDVHPGEGTAIRLMSLSDTTYMEILGRDPAQAESCLAPEVRDLDGSGLYHWALGGADIAGLRSHAVVAGLNGGELVAGRRTLPNGQLLGWQCFGIHNHGFGAFVPFFIDWLETEHPAKTAPRAGRLEEIAGLYVYLASDEATYASGGIFTFDGTESVGSAATTL
jgi:hypothetical protein